MRDLRSIKFPELVLRQMIFRQTSHKFRPLLIFVRIAVRHSNSLAGRRYTAIDEDSGLGMLLILHLCLVEALKLHTGMSSRSNREFPISAGPQCL